MNIEFIQKTSDMPAGRSGRRALTVLKATGGTIMMSVAAPIVLLGVTVAIVMASDHARHPHTLTEWAGFLSFLAVGSLIGLVGFWLIYSVFDRKVPEQASTWRTPSAQS